MPPKVQGTVYDLVSIRIQPHRTATAPVIRGRRGQSVGHVRSPYVRNSHANTNTHQNSRTTQARHVLLRLKALGLIGRLVLVRPSETKCRSIQSPRSPPFYIAFVIMQPPLKCPVSGTKNAAGRRAGDALVAPYRGMSESSALSHSCSFHPLIFSY
jgi:hypothetical protein